MSISDLSRLFTFCAERRSIPFQDFVWQVSVLLLRIYRPCISTLTLFNENFPIFCLLTLIEFYWFERIFTMRSWNSSRCWCNTPYVNFSLPSLVFFLFGIWIGLKFTITPTCLWIQQNAHIKRATDRHKEVKGYTEFSFWVYTFSFDGNNTRIRQTWVCSL